MLVRLFSYVVADDSGFAPNPFWGWCTLACCKPGIRRQAEVGDWILGLEPKALGSGLVYAMRVGEKLTFAEYWRDPRFRCKRPDRASPSRQRRYGDNIYRPLRREPFSVDHYRQLPSEHSDGDREDRHTKARDLGGGSVLVADWFVYLGDSVSFR